MAGRTLQLAALAVMANPRLVAPTEPLSEESQAEAGGDVGSLARRERSLAIVRRAAVGIWAAVVVFRTWT
ncbi:MAG TPA: hypothetical protein VMU34_14810, partial [Mycobacterium sp.]|nr:hypothetical protein [Mycobacterium sp.]